jgi:hypothetical protein
MDFTDEFELHEAFHLPGQNVKYVIGTDGRENVYSFPLAGKTGLLSKECAKQYCAYGVNGEKTAFCTICNSGFNADDLWNCQKHMIRHHQHMCSYEEISQYGSSTFLKEKERAWDAAKLKRKSERKKKMIN